MSDFLVDLRRAAAELNDLAEGRHLEEVLGAAWTTSSEMLGEIGQAIRGIERAHAGALPPNIRKSFDRAWAEIHKVWPEI